MQTHTVSAVFTSQHYHKQTFNDVFSDCLYELEHLFKFTLDIWCQEIQG